MYQEQYDVIVVGGGTGGIMAAIAAGRDGARTLLIEQYGFLGGTATAGGLCNMASFFYKDEQVIKGQPQEFMDRLVAMGGATPHLRALKSYGSGYYASLYNRELFKTLALEMVLEAGTDILFHSLLVNVVTEDKHVKGVVVENKSGSQTYLADVVIDCTGDADVAYHAGAECVMGDGDGVIQPGSLMFDMANVDIDKLHGYVMATLDDYDVKTEQIPVDKPIPKNLQQRQFVAQGFYKVFRGKVLSGEVYSAKESILFTTTALPGVISLNSTRVHFDPTDAAQRTKAVIDGRKQAQSIANFLIANIPGFENAYFADSGIDVGFRESRHIVGEYTMQAEDVRRGRRFDDVIARYGFPVDIHKETKGSWYDVQDRRDRTVEGMWIENDDAYDLPYRCLIPKRINGLIVVGRCISVSHVAHGSTRLMPLVMAEGQAAGIAAKLAVDSGVDVRAIDIKTLQKCLLEKGASLYRDLDAKKMESERAKAAIKKFLAKGDSVNNYNDVEWFDE
jgi:succinate dehydrogenase/fumarate reductase flavoprotein subunit